jgi:uncharacterized protein YoxC
VFVELVLVIAQIVALLCLSALCVYMILVLLRVRDTLGNVEKDVRDITTRALPVLDNMEYITTRIKSITDSIDDQVVAVRDSIASVKQVAENVVEMERKVQERIEGPILDTIALVSAVFKGVRAFFDRVRT